MDGGVAEKGGDDAPTPFFLIANSLARFPRTIPRLSNREKLGMDQVFVVWTSKSGLNQMELVF